MGGAKWPSGGRVHPGRSHWAGEGSPWSSPWAGSYTIFIIWKYISYICHYVCHFGGIIVGEDTVRRSFAKTKPCIVQTKQQGLPELYQPHKLDTLSRNWIFAQVIELIFKEHQNELVNEKVWSRWRTEPFEVWKSLASPVNGDISWWVVVAAHGMFLKR